MKNKVMKLDDAMLLIKDGDTVVTSGIAGSATPNYLLYGIEKRFLETGSPKDLTAIHAAGQGDFAKTLGMNRYAHEGMLKCLIGGHFNSCLSLVPMILDNKFAAYNLPQGVINDMYHARIKGMPGHITKLGLKTFVDPRLEGGKVNPKAVEMGDLVKVVEVDGEEYLMYKAPIINIGFVRGTTADKFGNISIEEESLPVDVLQVAMATKASGGIVMCEVKYTCDRLMTDKVHIPGNLVDVVVVDDQPMVTHKMTNNTYYNPTMAGHCFIPEDEATVLPFDAKKIICRRAAMELTPDAVINLGIGTPEGVANLCAEEGASDIITMTSESGAVAGIPMGGLDFGAVQNAWAIIPANVQFDYYDGNGLDATFLGNAETDEIGNVNVSKFGPKVAGCGGFINISQSTHNLYYLGTFTAGGLKESIVDGKLVIEQEGRQKKYIKKVQQVTFSGEFGAESGQNVLYISERCVFKLVKGGLKLIEIAPGVDLQKDILDQMDFVPIMDPEGPALMDERIFREDPMGLRDIILGNNK